ncbi:MAG TPA: hypothetical protein VEZ11_15735 [Thermoanaerobaculia bacterium]|nr:hypothetical protein [Thermoanaerobaculia bacterium]
MARSLTSRRWWWLYVGWIAICGVLFVALSGAEDPSRRRDRILSDEAGTRALAILQKNDRARYRDYEVIHVAYAGKGEGAAEARWTVLCDRDPRSGLREAVVVELDAKDGRVLRIRAPRR